MERRRMTRPGTLGLVILAAALTGLAACGRKAPDRPGREMVTPLLQKEADSLKSDGEKLDPILRVKATWTIEGLDVTERPSDPDQPWAGTIRFRIQSVMRDEQGVVTTDVFERRFDYVFNATLGRWIFELPPSPAP
jgi:predicted small lipoprotein YifL